MGVEPIYITRVCGALMVHLQGLRTSHEIMRVIKISHEKLFFDIWVLVDEVDEINILFRNSEVSDGAESYSIIWNRL